VYQYGIYGEAGASKAALQTAIDSK
jgi:hypothetical protein